MLQAEKPPRSERSACVLLKGQWTTWTSGVNVLMQMTYHQPAFHPETTRRGGSERGDRISLKTYTAKHGHIFTLQQCSQEGVLFFWRSETRRPPAGRDARRCGTTRSAWRSARAARSCWTSPSAGRRAPRGQIGGFQCALRVWGSRGTPKAKKRSQAS